MFLHDLLHAALDGLRLIPFLFVSYVIIELVEHKLDVRHIAFLQRSGRIGPLVSSLLGLFPQCGFSAATASLYSYGIVSRGTLLAAFLATSDEMLPILIANRVSGRLILFILAIKALSGMLTGFLVDGIENKKKGTLETRCSNLHIENTCKYQGKHIFLSALYQTIKIAVFLIVVIFLVDLAVEVLGFESMHEFVLKDSIWGPLLAGVLGFVPSCAVSVVFTTLCLQNCMSLGALLSGLLVGSGTGILILIRTNRNVKDNLVTLLLLYIAGVLVGLFTEIILIF